MHDTQDESTRPTRGVSRRQFLKGVGIAGAGTALGADILPTTEEDESGAQPLARAAAGQTLTKGFQDVTLTVNGRATTVSIEPRTTLLNALRNHAEPAITGPKLVCDQGACGACTVMVDGHTAYACLLLAADLMGRQITTVEGLAPVGQMSHVQQAFVEHDAMMCGFCTPGFVVSVSGLLKSNSSPTLADVQAACSGNYCRCGTYPKLFEAALDAAKRTRGGA